MIYLDNNATTQLDPKVRDAMLPFLTEGFGNPSSAHAAGRQAREAVENARRSVAELLGANPSEIVFTSGGTESDNWAIRGALASAPAKKHIVTTRVEHEAVRKLCEQLEREGYEVSWIDVDEQGLLDPYKLRDSLRDDTALVSTMLANNETGVLFSVEHIGSLIKQKCSALFHVDAVNAAGKINIELDEWDVDLLSISSHKFHGPKGVGALYIRDGVTLPASAIGGGQESGRRAGTEAVHQIVGLGAAAELALNCSTSDVRALRDRLERGILDSIPIASLNGHPEHRLPNTSNISFENLNGEAIMARLDAAGICVSTGSACNAENHEPSAVLQAMEVPYSKAMGSIRFSLGRFNTEAEIETVIGEVKKVVAELGRFS